MSKLEKKHNYFYKITNLVNSKYYYGIHSTDNLDDGYMGTGIAIKKAIKKHNIKNFIKDIIADYPTRKEASDHEARVVTLELIKLKECYNCRTGGDNEYTFTHSKETRKKYSEMRKGKLCGENNPMYGKKVSEEIKQKIKEKKAANYCRENHPMFGKKGKNNPRYGQKHSEEAKFKIRNSHIGRKAKEETITKMRNQPSCKPCNILNIVYPSVGEASRQLKMLQPTIEYRLKSKSAKFSEWRYC